MQIYETFSSFGPLAFISKLFFCRYRHYVLRNKSTNTRTYCTEFLPTIYYWLIEKNHMFPTQKCQNFGSLAPLARNHLCVFSSFCFSGRNKSSWTRPYHECYEHKDIIYCTDKPCDLSTEYWRESYVSDPKIPQISARSQYSFFISFWFSGRLKKPYTFLTQSRKSAKISARSLCSLITINGFFSSFWNVSGRYKSSWIYKTI